MIIGYDLDGVLTPDVSIKFITPHFPVVDEENLKLLNKVRANQLPILQPTGTWYLITARSMRDQEEVKSWVAQNFYTQPKAIIHECEDFEVGSAYKARVLNEILEIDLYIESDRVQAQDIRKLTRASCSIATLGGIVEFYEKSARARAHSEPKRWC